MRPVLLILILALLGCGQRGALYLPEEPASEVVTVQPTGQQAEQPSSGTETGSPEDEEEDADPGTETSDKPVAGDPGNQPSGSERP